MFNFLPRTFYLGPLTLHLYGITLVLGVIVGLLVAMRLAKEKSLNPDYVIDFIPYALITGIILARLVFVIQNLPTFFAHPVSIFFFQEGGLSIHGGLLGGLLAGIWFVRKKQLSFWNFADIIVPGLAIGEAIGRNGCDLYGKPVSAGILPIIINGGKYHNIALYTGTSSLVIFIILWLVRKNVKPGSLLPLYLMLYSTARFFIEFTRESAMIGLLSVAQIASAVLILISGFVLIALSRKKPNSSWLNKAAERINY